MTTIPDYITARQAAKLCKVSVRRIQVLAEAGRITGAKKLGRDWLIPPGFTVTPAPKRPKKMLKL
jgi:excisionase family DNA binding protein